MVTNSIINLPGVKLKCRSTIVYVEFLMLSWSKTICSNISSSHLQTSRVWLPPLISASAYCLQCSSRDYSTKCKYYWLQRLVFCSFHWSSVDSLNPGKIFVKQFFISRESFHCPSHLLAQYYGYLLSLNLHFKVAELNTVFKCLCLIHHYLLTIYAWCPFFAKGKVTQWKVYWCILARACAAVNEAE